ncbi:MAG: TonB-dependent receptor [Bacteroidales bacterium]|nr:TonB-dependent receptor [Bacteroidales bacterium]
MKTLSISKVSAVLMFLFCSIQAMGQNVITGVVSDELGALPGVNVMLKGTGTGTSTGMDGEYSIAAEAGQTLVFSFMGYVDQEIVVGKSARIDVIMSEDAQQLEALVVVGYGVQRRKDITGSVASVNMDDMKYSPGSDAADLLRGRVAGLEITASSGRPGSTSDIKIRGTRSLTGGNTPLYIIDGVPATGEEFGTLNSSDIESIEVLKDAASQAVYGTRAANGVILVSTKRGRAEKVRVTWDSYGAVQTLWRNFDFYDGEQYYALRREAIAGDRGYLDPSDYSLLDMETVLNDSYMEDAYKNKRFTDWESLMLKPSWTHKHDLSISGGSEKTRFALGVGYYDQDGMVRSGSRYRRATVRANVDMNVFKWLSIGLNASYAKSVQDREYGSFSNFITRPPLAKVKNEDGSYTEYINGIDTNPLHTQQYFERQIDRDHYKLNTFFDIKPFKGFNYRLNLSYYNKFSEDGQYLSSQAATSTGQGSIDETKYENYLIENIITYTVPINDTDHRLNLTLMQSYDYIMDRGMGYSAQNVTADRDWNMLPKGEVTEITRKWQDETMISFMGRAQYSYKDRYLVTVSVRRDADSKFGSNNKWATFPSVSAGWIISDEPWMRNASFVSNLKLRASWGQVGSHSGLSRYKSLGLANSYEMEFGDDFAIGYLPGSELSNPNIGWETTSSTNAGVDFSLFNDRFRGSVEGFYTETKDLLVQRSISSSLGYSTITDNMGETSTWGIDISMNGDIVSRNGFIWNMGANFSLYRNKILRINGLKDENGNEVDDVNNKWFIGQPLNVYYDYAFDGIYQFEDFDNIGGVFVLKKTYDTDGDGVPDKALERDAGFYPGAVKVKDVNNDGKITADDRVVISKDPKFTMSLNTSFKWKGLDLYADFYGVYGRIIQNKYLYDYNSGGSLAGRFNGLAVNYWTPTHPSNDYPRPRGSQSINYHESLSYQDASYVRLRTLTLGYTFPSSLLSKAKIDRLRFYVTGTNVFTLTRFLSYSPELSPGSYPEARQWLFGVNIGF